MMSAASDMLEGLGEMQGFWGVCVACLGEVGGNEGHADPEICFIEVVRNIPAELPILAPFLNNSVKEGQDPHQRPECLHNDAQHVITKCGAGTKPCCA